MKKPKVRPTTADGISFGITGRETPLEKLRDATMLAVFGAPAAIATAAATGQSEWAHYSSIDDAVKDILLWMDYTKFPKETLSLRSHIDEMKKRKYFAEDLDYYLKAVIAWEAR